MLPTPPSTQLNEEELEEERRRARPESAILNETAYDRRRVAAVYKGDGRRGHHMQVGVTCVPVSNVVCSWSEALGLLRVYQLVCAAHPTPPAPPSARPRRTLCPQRSLPSSQPGPATRRTRQQRRHWSSRMPLVGEGFERGGSLVGALPCSRTRPPFCCLPSVGGSSLQQIACLGCLPAACWDGRLVLRTP